MPRTLEEKHGKEAFKLILLATRAACAGTILLAAWLTWDTWAAVRDGELAAASARNGYQMMIAFVLLVCAFAAVQWHGARPHPPQTRRFAVWAAGTALACAALPVAALLALPASG